MEVKPETRTGKTKLKDYVRWSVIGLFLLVIFFVMVMAIYRKFGG